MDFSKIFKFKSWFSKTPKQIDASDPIYTDEEFKSIKEQLIDQLIDCATENYILFLDNGDEPKQAVVFDFGEYINCFSPDFGYEDIPNPMAAGLRISEEEARALAPFVELLYKYKKSYEGNYDINIEVLKDPKWHVVQEKARSVLKAFNIEKEIPRIRILEEKLSDPQYCKEELQKFMESIQHIDEGYLQSFIQKYDFNCLVDDAPICFLDIYCTFSLKAEFILKHTESFKLSPAQKQAIEELLQKMDGLYHTIVGLSYNQVKISLTNNPDWIEVQKMAKKVLVTE